jgi:hypothetical protein
MLVKAIREYDDPALVPALKAWLRRKKRLPKSEQEEVARLVRFLERDR